MNIINVYQFELEWDDFVNKLLLKGEVKEIFISDSLVAVTFHPGATYNGRQIGNNTSRYAVLKHPPPMSVEDKIRDIEKTMGISGGIMTQRYLILIH